MASSTNKRTDQYGGSLPNRSRIIGEIARAVRQRVPEGSGFILGIKINSVEFQSGGFSTEEARDMCAALEKDSHFDFVELSGGTYEELAFTHRRESTKKREAFFLEFADAIAPGLEKTKTFVTGGVRTVATMVKALETVDGIGLARPVCQEPHLPRHILEGKVKNGAIEQKLDQNDFGITNVAAGTQIRQLGKDQTPLDLSSEDNVKVFQESMKKWAEKMADNEAGDKYGYVDIEGISATPYAASA